MKYVIIDSTEVALIDFNQVSNSKAPMLRYSVDGSKTFVKYKGTQPSFLSGKTEYDIEEILSILSDPEWTSEEIN
jgi:hypothetical protein